MGVRVKAPLDTIFLPGFMCQLTVQILGKLNVSTLILICRIFQSNIIRLLVLWAFLEDVVVYANGIVIRCPGLFQGEGIVILEERARSIVFVLMALKPDIELFLAIFNQICERSFPQCIIMIFITGNTDFITKLDMCGELHRLCPQCIEMCFLQPGVTATNMIGKITDINGVLQVKTYTRV